jgi:ligand-binding sensor domain-containing protein
MRKTLLFLFLLIVYSWCFSQRTTSKIKYYSPREYGKGREATNNACIQDKTGVLYFGNAGGLLKYNGVSWSFIPVKNQSVWVQSLAVSDDNIVYVGAQGEFGYLAPDASGKLNYVSLSDNLMDNQTAFSDIIRVWAWKNNVVFQSQEAIFLYSDKKLTALYPETSFYVSSLVNDELYVRQRGIGIMKLSGNNLVLVKGSEYLKDIGVFSILESSDPEKYTIVTRVDGFWSVNKETFAGSAIETEDSIIFRQSEIYGAIKLDDGRIAINTLLNGIIITDETFKIHSFLNKENGLKVNGVNSLIQDYQGNIWAALENGIAQIFYYSPLSIFGPESGISGNVRAIIRYNGNLFAGTT